MKTFKDYLSENENSLGDIQSILTESHDLTEDQEIAIDVLTGFALGKTVGKAIAKVLGIQKGALYDLLTSRLIGAALGAVLGKRL